MKTAVILAGGIGSRLKPLTFEIPKPLIPIRGITLLEHLIIKLEEANITDVFLSIGYMHDKIQNFIEELSKRKTNLKFHFLIETERLGTAGWINLVNEVEKEKYFSENFIVVNGDNLFDLNWRKFEDSFNGKCTIALTSVNNVSEYGVAKLDGNKIETFIEKPSIEDAPSNKINSGYYICSPELFNLNFDKKNIMFETDIFPLLAKEGKLYSYLDDSKWFDTGTFERWENVINNW